MRTTRGTLPWGAAERRSYSSDGCAKASPRRRIVGRSSGRTLLFSDQQVELSEVEVYCGSEEGQGFALYICSRGTVSQIMYTLMLEPCVIARDPALP